MASGSFFFIVGPSGAGKDSLIDGARQKLDPTQFIFATRTITRPADSGGEAHQACTQSEFAQLEQQGKFLITWQAHNLSYGLPSTLLEALAAGQHVIANGSRAMVAQLNERVPNLVVVEIGAAESLDPALEADVADTLATIATLLVAGITISTHQWHRARWRF